jgi:hypothetical protein
VQWGVPDGARGFVFSLGAGQADVAQDVIVQSRQPAAGLQEGLGGKQAREKPPGQARQPGAAKGKRKGKAKAGHGGLQSFGFVMGRCGRIRMLEQCAFLQHDGNE